MRYIAGRNIYVKFSEKFERVFGNFHVAIIKITLLLKLRV
jgi:hypothetical protein